MHKPKEIHNYYCQYNKIITQGSQFENPCLKYFLPQVEVLWNDLVKVNTFNFVASN